MPHSRSVIITGGTAGLGFFAPRDIAKAHADYLVVLASRTDGDGAADKINADLGQRNTVYVPLDLSDNASVRTFAENWASNKYPPIQALLLNAGLQFPGTFAENLRGPRKDLRHQPRWTRPPVSLSLPALCTKYPRGRHLQWNTRSRPEHGSP